MILVKSYIPEAKRDGTPSYLKDSLIWWIILCVIYLNKKGCLKRDNLIRNHYFFTKSPLPTPQIGQTQSSGRSSKAVPAGTSESGSPTAGSYS